MVSEKEFCNLCRTHLTCYCHPNNKYDFETHRKLWEEHVKTCTKEFQYVMPNEVEPHYAKLCGECLEDRCSCGSPRHCGIKTKINDTFYCENCNCILCIDQWKKKQVERIQALSNSELFDEVTQANCQCLSTGNTYELLDEWASKQKEVILRDRLRNWLLS